MKGPHGKVREALPDAPGWALVKLPRAGRQALVRYRRNGHVMTATDLPGLIECADGKNGYERFRTWVVAQAIRNALQAFHGDSAFDPDDPGSRADFKSATGRCAP